MPSTNEGATELHYVILLFALFVIPRVVQRYRIPAAITSVFLGALVGLGLGWLEPDTTSRLLAILGIVSLFLLAGLDVNFEELRANAGVLTQHVVIQVLVLFGCTFVVSRMLTLEYRPAALVALALLTPSTGFILDSLRSLGLSEQERFWTKSKAIATELVALGVLFVTLQSTTAGGLAISTLVLGGLVALLPLVFRAFASLVAPYAPKSEFAFLLMIAVLCAFATRKLGVYYLVGAFVVGLTAQRFRERLPAIASEEMLHAIEVFASVFVPFYFFGAGLHLGREDFGLGALLLGIALLIIVVPLRVALVAVHRRLVVGEPLRTGARIGMAMLPTLVFTLVLAQILRDRFGVPGYVFGGLIIYTLANTLIPGFALRKPSSGRAPTESPGLEGASMTADEQPGTPNTPDNIGG